MKILSKILLSSLLCLPSLALKAQDGNIIPFNLDDLTAIPFQPLRLEDLQDPVNGQALKPGDMITILENGRQVSYKAQDLLDKYNKTERTLNSIGKTLRGGEVNLSIQAIANPDIWLRQKAQDIGMDMITLAENAKPKRTDCPMISLSSLGHNPLTRQPFKADDAFGLAQQEAMKAGDLVSKLNEQQQIFCRFGYALTDVGLAPGMDGYLAQLLEKRQELLRTFKLSEFNSAFALAEQVLPLSPDQVEARVQEVKDLLEKPTPERVYGMAQKLGGLVPEDLKLPAIPSIPGPQLEKRHELRLRKEWHWNGIDKGERSTANIYANARGELRSGRVEDPAEAPSSDQSFQALAQGGVWLLNHQISILDGKIDSRLDKKNAYALARFCFLGNCMEKRGDIRDYSYSFRDPKLFYKNWRESYSQQLSVGPVPVVLRVGGAMTTQLGYDLGINLLGISGGGLAMVNASAFGEAAVGIDGFVEAGAGGEVTLIENTTEIRADAGVRFIGNGIPTLQGSLVGTNNLKALHGRIYAYALIDILGPLGAYAEEIVSALKDLGAAGKALMEKLYNLSDYGRKLIEGVDGGLEAIGKGLKKAGKKVASWLGFSRSHAAHGVPMGLSIKGSKIRYEHDWVHWPGFNKTYRFLNYKLYVGPDGKSYGGDMADAQPREVEQLEQNLTLAARRDLIATLESKAKAYEDNVIAAVQKQDLSDNKRLLNEYRQRVLTIFQALDRDSLKLVQETREAIP